MLFEREKARVLVTGIKNKVKLNPKNYHKLMRYFHRDRRMMYGDILDKEYLRLGAIVSGVARIGEMVGHTWALQ